MKKKSITVRLGVILCVVTFAVGIITGISSYALFPRTTPTIVYSSPAAPMFTPIPTVTATAKPTTIAPNIPIEGPKQDYSKLDEIISIIHENAFNDVTNEDLINAATNAMIGAIRDKHSNIYTKSQWEAFLKQEEGKYVGIGVSINTDANKIITVDNVYKGSPAEVVGMRMGDKIVKVDDTDVRGMDIDSVIQLVRGKSGTKVRILVLRDKGETLDFLLTRADVTEARTTWRMLEDNIGYIRILEFQGNAADLFDQALQEFKAQRIRGLVLDLRYNPGGDLDLVSHIADELLPVGLIVKMINRNGEVERRIDSDANCLDIPMVVLVNRSSASASELLSGDIQDYKLGLLIGETTLGKGTAQSYKTLSDGSVVKLTTSTYLTAGGRSPEGVGFTPDITVKLNKEVAQNPSLFCTSKDNQYTRALKEIKKLLAESKKQ